MQLKETIEGAGKALTEISHNERGTFILIMLCSLATIIFLVIYFLGSIQKIVSENQEAIKIQRQEFLESQKIRDYQFVEAIYDIKNKK